MSLVTLDVGILSTVTGGVAQAPAPEQPKHVTWKTRATSCATGALTGGIGGAITGGGIGAAGGAIAGCITGLIMPTAPAN